MDVSIDAMEVSPKVLRDVQFREKIRGGYHPEDVDEFLEQAAVGSRRCWTACGTPRKGRSERSYLRLRLPPTTKL